MKAALIDTPVVMVTGPRQCGKTTLVRGFTSHRYITLDDDTVLEAARGDPSGFVRGLDQAIVDEVQRAPLLFSYLQEILDNSKTKGLFILSGSNNFLLQQSISQTLAGRVGYINLLPFSITELVKAKLLP